MAGPGLGGGAGDRDPVIQFNFLIYKPEEKGRYNIYVSVLPTGSVDNIKTI